MHWRPTRPRPQTRTAGAVTVREPTVVAGAAGNRRVSSMRLPRGFLAEKSGAGLSCVRVPTTSYGSSNRPRARCAASCVKFASARDWRRARRNLDGAAHGLCEVARPLFGTQRTSGGQKAAASMAPFIDVGRLVSKCGASDLGESRQRRRLRESCREHGCVDRFGIFKAKRARHTEVGTRQWCLVPFGAGEASLYSF